MAAPPASEGPRQRQPAAHPRGAHPRDGAGLRARRLEAGARGRRGATRDRSWLGRPPTSLQDQRAPPRLGRRAWPGGECATRRGATPVVCPRRQARGPRSSRERVMKPRAHSHVYSTRYHGYHGYLPGGPAGRQGSLSYISPPPPPLLTPPTAGPPAVRTGSPAAGTKALTEPCCRTCTRTQAVSNGSVYSRSRSSRSWKGPGRACRRSGLATADRPRKGASGSVLRHSHCPSYTMVIMFGHARGKIHSFSLPEQCCAGCSLAAASPACRLASSVDIRAHVDTPLAQPAGFQGWQP
eukprot:scaffold337_cov393-Prasinococcus_capsulatus_cf.AAC.7